MNNNIISKRIKENYNSKTFNICDKENIINYKDKNEKFRWVNATLVKWYNKYYINLNLNVSNVYTDEVKHKGEKVIPANDLIREIKFYEQPNCITNCPTSKYAKYHHSEFGINRDKLKDIEVVNEFFKA